MQERMPALIFTVCGRRYGLLQDGGAALLPWLQRYAPASPVPGVPAWMLGLLGVQGTVQAIVDLGAFLGFGATVPGDDTRLIFVEHDELRVGMLVDGASGIRYLDTVDYTGYHDDEPLVAAVGAINGQQVCVLDGVALLDSLARALGSPLAGRA